MDIGMLPSGEGTGISYPASLAQARFWLLDALDPGTPALNVAVRWTLLGPASHAVVEAAMRRIVARHEILRTALHEVDGMPIQVVRPTPPFRVRHRDLSHLPAAESAAEAERIGAQEAQTPFALEVAPLIRVALITLAPQTARLLVTMHHAICDGWSVGVLARELMAELAADALPELPLQYGDYAEWQQAWLESPVLDAARDYWMQQLAALPYVRMPPDHAAAARGAGAITSVLLPRALTDRMAATAARAGCTPFSVALAALGGMLQARTKADDIPIGTQVAGRTEVELEGMIGPFINTLVLRLDLTGAPDWDARVARAATTVEGALHHHAMPFELLIRALNPKRSQLQTPLFSVNLIFQRSFVGPSEGGGIQLVDMPSHSAGALYDLNFFMVERPDGWRASCEYDTALFEAGTVEAMLAEWQRCLAGEAAIGPAGKPAEAVLERLAAIWCEILGIASVQPRDGFFDLGGHSLLAARMLARVEAVFGQRVGMAALFADDTLAGLAARLAPAPGGRAGSTLVAIGPAAPWVAVQQALARAPELICLPDAAPEQIGRLPPTGTLLLLASGAGGPDALQLANALAASGRAVTLILADAAPPQGRGGLWPFKTNRDGPVPFSGRAILFRQAGIAPDPMKGWGNYLRGELELLPLPDGSWHGAVAQRIAKELE